MERFLRLSAVSNCFYLLQLLRNELEKINLLPYSVSRFFVFRGLLHEIGARCFL